MSCEGFRLRLNCFISETWEKKPASPTNLERSIGKIETVAESILDSKENLTVIDVNNDNKPIGILQPKKVITVLFGK